MTKDPARIGNICRMPDLAKDRSFLIRPDREQEPPQGIANLLRVEGSRMAGRVAVIEHPIAPGVLVPPHTHTREDEVSYVVRGTIGARVGDEFITAPPGAYVLKPRGIPHAFWNAGPEPARIVEMIVPAGFERFFAELDELARQGPLDSRAHAALGQRFGVRYHDEWIAELAERFGVGIPT